MILYGASGHAKVVCSCLEAQNIEIQGIFDQNTAIKHLDFYPVMGQYQADFLPNESLIIAIGNNEIRKKVASEVTHSFGIVQHPSAIIDKLTSIDVGTVVFQQAIIQRGSKLGKHIIVNSGASIDHDCQLSDFVHISPKAVICGNVNIGEGTHIGAGATVIQGIKIGQWAVIGAGAVVIRDVPDDAVVVGNPAKIVRVKKQ
jgi:sugar O-acyltransferase (sialic acid O-acetyltransferase NeuD family)